MIQLSKAGVTGSPNLKECANLFKRFHAFRLPQLLHPELAQVVSAQLERCTWTTHVDGEIAKDAAPDDPAAGNVLNFAANTPEFLEIIRRITNLPKIKSFGGRLYRMSSAEEHFDSWHSDLGGISKDRLVGMSINVSPQPYQGGIFRLRDEASGQILYEFSNTGPGDAILFRISPSLKHMVTPIIGSQSKTAFAGWFRSGDTDFYTTLKP
jgi:hypothetical protein